MMITTVAFMERLEPEPNTGCWLWTGAYKGNYGALCGRLAHRVAYELFRGPIPAGLQIDHLCAVKMCVNPDHLDAVTGLENHRRWSRSRTHCRNGHRLMGERRDCPECREWRSLCAMAWRIWNEPDSDESVTNSATNRPGIASQTKPRRSVRAS